MTLSPAGIRLGVLPPLALYVHIPWCVKKCPYCDFNSHQARGDVPERAYVEALVTDLELALPDVWGRRVTSIFFGGGTPSLFSAAAIDTLISAFRARLSLAADCEITLEANPGTFEAEKFRGYREAGVNRLSIGVQSFNPKHLKALGRIHDDREARSKSPRTHSTTSISISWWRSPSKRSPRRAPTSKPCSRPAPRICPSTISRSSRTRFSTGIRPCCRMTMRRRRCRTPSAPPLPRAATRTTRLRRGRSPAANAATISTTGASAITSASGRAPTAK